MWRSPHSSASSGIVLGLDGLASLSGDPVALSCSEHGFKFVHIAGVVRPADIATNNTVTSDKLADAHISYSGKGAVDSSNRMGWLARFFNSPFAPF